jgi:phospholipid/cholesterol/gamma-HCH transport system ATP-binding protein
LSSAVRKRDTRDREVVVEVRDIRTSFGERSVHKGVTFSVRRGEVAALIGSSGSGKSVLLREIIGLMRPSSGSVSVLGTDIWTSSAEEVAEVRRRFGVLFQEGALFSNLTVAQNVEAPMVEHLSLPPELRSRLVDLRLSLSGLSPKEREKMPSELSGGMKKRAALARALSLEPEILFLDEPTSGLDPITARQFDELVKSLAHNVGIAVLMTTHDLDTLLGIVDQLIVLDEGMVIAQGSVDDVRRIEHPWIKEYFASRV